MEDLLVSKGLDFEVQNLPVTVYNPKSGLFVESPEHTATMRMDNGHIYTIGTKRHQIIQPADLMDMLVRYYGYDTIRNSRVIKSDRNATAMSVLINNGNKFSKELELESYLTIDTSLDRSTAFSFGITDEILVCSNGLTRKEYKKMFSMRHTHKNMDAVLDSFSDQVHRFEAVYEEHYGFYQILKDTPATTADSYAFIDEILGVDLSIPNIEDKLHSRTLHSVNALKAQVNQSFREQGNNRFALLQSVTRYTTHDIMGAGPVSTQFGWGYKLNNKAYEFLQNLN